MLNVRLGSDLLHAGQNRQQVQILFNPYSDEHGQ